MALGGGRERSLFLGKRRGRRMGEKGACILSCTGVERVR